MRKKTVLFYSSVKTKKMFSLQSYYRNDILILKELGYCVRLSNSIKDFFQFWKYDVAFLYFYKYSFFCAVLSRFFGKKVYFTGGIDYLEKKFATPKQRRIQALFFKLCNIFSTVNILVSTTDSQNVSELYDGKLPHKCVLSYHVVDFERFKFDKFTDKKEDIVTTIGWMVRIDNVYRKGIDKTIKAFSVFVKNHPTYKLYIAGPSGEGSEYICKLILSLKLNDSVTYLGSISEEAKISLLKRSKIYTQLSIYEGFGIASVEALAAGNIVVHSGNGGLKDAVGHNGYEVDIDNLQSIVNGLDAAASDFSNGNISEQGILYAEAKFTFDKRLNDFKNILNH